MFYRLYCFFLAILLRGINPLKSYGTWLFEALARLTIGLAFEAACVRRHPETRKIQVGLAKRVATESFAPGAWHFPGTFYRPWETPVDVLKRLVKKEFGRLRFDQAIFVGLFRASKTDIGRERGHTNSEVWLFLGAEFGEKVEWFDHDDLPDNVFYSHLEHFILWAIAAFERWEVSRDPAAVPRVDIIQPAAID